MKGKDLKPGMLITKGLVLDVNMNHPLYAGEPAYTFICSEDAYMVLIGSLELDAEYEVLAEPGDPKYKEALTTMAREQMNIAKQSMEYTARVLAFLDNKD